MNREQMVEEQIKACNDVMHEFGGELNTTHLHVTKSYDAHTELLKSWGGWKRTFKVDDANYTSSGNDIRSVFESCHVDGSLAYNVLRPRYSGKVWEHDKIQSTVIGGPYPANVYTYFITSCCAVERPDTPLRIGQGRNKAILRALNKIVWPKNINGHLIIEQWQRFLMKLGERQLNVDSVWKIVLDCSPSAFMLLGHYGEDGSCYRTGREYEDAKLLLSRQRDTFVGLIYDEHNDLRGRFWGRLKPRNWLAIANIYMMTMDSAVPMLKQMVKMLGIKYGSYNNCEDELALVMSFHDDRIFVNPNVLLWGIGSQIFRDCCNYNDSDDGPLFSRKRCNCCENTLDNDNLHLCGECGNTVCSNCSDFDVYSNTYGGYVCTNCITEYLERFERCDNCTSMKPIEEINNCEKENCYFRYCNGCAKCECERQADIERRRVQYRFDSPVTTAINSLGFDNWQATAVQGDIEIRQRTPTPPA